MKIQLHKNATTTPAQRAFIQNSPHLSVAYLAEKTGVSKTTIRRWRNRSSVYDRSHTPKRIKTALTPIEEAKIVLCRLATRAGLDDLHKILESLLSIHCSRASLNRCLKRYHISRIPPLQQSVPFDLNDYTGTYFLYTCFHLPGLSARSGPLQFHTLLDCSFRIFHADFSYPGREFLARHIREFPLQVLGILYEDPILLAPGDFSGENRRQTAMIEEQCRTFNLVSHPMGSQHTETVQKLMQTLGSLDNGSQKAGWSVPWSGRIELGRHISRYNTGFTLGSLKQKTPSQAMEFHYAHFPNSFRQRPQIPAIG